MEEGVVWQDMDVEDRLVWVPEQELVTVGGRSGLVEAWEATEAVRRLGRFGVEDTASVKDRRVWRRGDKFVGGEEADAYPESEAAGEEDGTGLDIVDHERRADRIPAAQEMDQERLDAQRASTALRIAAGKS